MARLQWGATGEKKYETGVDRGVLFVAGDDGTYNPGVAWNGLSSVSETPEGAEPTDLYADNIKYATLMSAETFKGTVEAYAYPEEFAQCDGSSMIAEGVYIGQQNRKKFAFSYRTGVGSDTNSDIETTYKIHIVYGCTCSVSERTYETVNDSPDAITLSWEYSSVPVNVTGHKATSVITIDSAKVGAANMKLIEDKLYGTESEEPTLLLPDEILELIAPEG